MIGKRPPSVYSALLLQGSEILEKSGTRWRRSVGQSAAADLDLADLKSRHLYRQSIVAFIDILGFSDHVRSIDGRNDDAAHLLWIFNHAKNFVRQHPVDGIELRFISDTFVITSPTRALTEHPWGATVLAAHAILEACKTIQSGLLLLGFLSRGAVTTGNMILEDDIVFGAPLIHAYHLESRIADYPRVIVDAALVTDLPPLEQTRLLRYRIELDDDGFYILDLFNSWAWEDEGIWSEGIGCAENLLSRESSDERDRDKLAEERAFFLQVRDVLTKMYDDTRDAPAYRRKVEWTIRKYNQKMANAFKSARARQFGLTAPDAIALTS